MTNFKKYIPVVTFIAGILLTGTIMLIFSNRNSGAVADNSSNKPEQTALPANINSDPIPNIDQKWVKGNPDGKIQIIEFSDFQCPYCSKGATSIQTVYDKYKDKMQLTFSHFPLTSIHPYALSAAKAAEAAGYQGKFWEMHDLLFANQNNLTQADLDSYAKKLGLDIAKFDKDMNNKNVETKILKQQEEAGQPEYDSLTIDKAGKIADGGKAKIEGTPAFLINGKLIVGAYPADQFEKLIQYFLNQK